MNLFQVHGEILGNQSGLARSSQFAFGYLCASRLQQSDGNITTKMSTGSRAAFLCFENLERNISQQW